MSIPSGRIAATILIMFNSDTRVLVTGCGGMLGDAVYHTFRKHCAVTATDIDCNADWLMPLDVRDRVAVEGTVDYVKPDIVLHLAAHTDMEFCETHSDEAYMTNAIGTEHVVFACLKRDLPMVYIGTAGVFDGAQEHYVDYDRPNPLSIYAKSKFAGEEVVRHHLSRYWIFRAGWMMGGGPAKDKKFIGKIIRQLQAGKRELFVVDDKLGSPTFTYDFAGNMLAVLQAEAYGLYHMAGQGECSRFDVAEELLKILGLNEKIALHKVESTHFATEYFAPRPDSEKLINLRLKLQGLERMRDWRESLRDYVSRFPWDIHA